VTDDKHQSDLAWLYDVQPTTPAVKPSAKAAAKPAADDDIDWLYGESAPEPRVTKQPGAAPPAPRIAPPTVPPAPRRTPVPPKPSQVRPGLPLGTRVKLTGVALIVALAAWAVFLVSAPLHAWNQVATVADTPTGKRPAQQPGTAILLVGTDSREGLTAAQKKAIGGTGGVLGSRTDVMLIYYVPPKGDPALISLPRDSFLPIPGHGKDKLNAAYVYGGPALLERTVEQATGLRIDGYMEIGFGGFINMVDAVGGVEVCLKKAMTDKSAHINLPAGCQILDGAKALGYVRQRYEDPLGDLGRVQRQREIIGKVLQKLVRPSTLIFPWRYWGACQAITSAVKKGQTTDSSVLKAAIFSISKVADNKAISLTVPISNPDAWTSAGSSVLWDTTKAKAMFAEIAQGDTSGLDKYK